MPDTPSTAAASILPPDTLEDPDERHPTRVCVIDLGTNSFHTVIVDAFPNGSFQVVDRIKEMVRLGERGLSKHKLTKDATDRALRALKRVRLLAEGHGVTEYLAYATSAIREAENGGDLIRRARQETGIRIRPISGGLEAQLIYQGVKRAIDLPRPALLVDIGGGSTEFIVADATRARFATSLKLGAARMTERFITTDPVGRDEFRALRTYYREQLRPIFASARGHGVREIVGSSGTMENMAQVYVSQFGDTSRSIYQQPFDAATFRKATKHIMLSSRAEREAMSAIDAKRVGQVVAGAILIDVLLKDLAVEQLRISPNALREGMVVHFIEENHRRLSQRAPFASVRRQSVHELGFRFRWDAAHARHVTALALQLFDACRPLHGLNGEARELLEYGALLHDVGYHISHRSHHKHSLYLIRNADLRGFQPEEVAIIANVARYHRRSLPKKSHTAFMNLSKSHRQLVRQLASFVRLAEGLDRSHFQNVIGLQARVDDEKLRLRIRTKSDPQLDVWGARRSSDLFEDTYGRTVTVRATQEPAPPSTEAPGSETPGPEATEPVAG